MPATSNSIPNQNNLFEIFQSQVESLSALNEVVVKAKINEKTAKRVTIAIEAVVACTVAIYDALDKISGGNEKKFAQANKTFDAATVTLNNILSVVNNLGEMGFGSVIMARIRIWRLYKVTWSLMKFLWRVGFVNPVVFTTAGLVIQSISKNVGALIDLTNQLGKVKMVWLARRSIRRLYKILFGHKPGEPRKPGQLGIYDLYRRLSRPNVTKQIIKGGISIKFMSSALNDLVKAVNIMGISLPLILMGWVSVKILNPITRGLIHIFKRMGRKMKVIIKGSIALNFMAHSLIGFVGSLVILGLIAVAALPLIGAAVLVIAGVVGLFVMLGFARRLIRHGYKAIKYIALAVAMLAMTAVVIALLGAFVVSNIAGFAMFALYMTILVGVFIALAFATKFIKKGGKTLLMITFCVGLLALIAIGMVLVGQFIQANLLAVGLMLLTMVTLVGLTIVVGLLHKKIEEGLFALIVVAAFALVMTIVVGLLAIVANTTDPLRLLEVTGIMLLIVVAIGAIALAAGKLIADIAMGIPALLMISIICTIMSGVMIALALAASIADPLEMLEVAGIMTLLIVAVGGIALAAGALLAGPQAVIFALGLVALGMISGLLALIGGIALLIGLAAKAIKETGFKSAEELAKVINMPFAAIIRGDGKESLFDILGDLPNPLKMLGIMAKVAMLSGIMCSVGNIADILQHIASLNMPDPDAGYDPKTGRPLGYKQMTSDDFAAAAVNASIILGMASAMFGDEPTTFTLADGTSFKVQVVDMSGLDKIGFMTRIKVKRLSKIVGYVGSMADTLQHIASLNMPAGEYDKDGKPISWKQMTGDDFANAAMNAGAILHFFTALFGDEDVKLETSTETFTISPIGKDALENLTLGLKWKMQRLGTIVNVVGGMADTLQHISSLTMPDAEAEYNENGRPNKWKKMDAKDFATAATTAGDMLRFFVALFDEKDSTLMLGGQAVVVKPISQDALDNISRSTKKKMESIGASVSVVSGLAETMSNMGQCIIPDIQNPATDIDPKTGKPLKWKAVNLGQAVRDAESTIWLILSGITSILGDKQLSEDLDDLNKDALENMALAMDGISGLTSVVDIIKMLAGGGMPTKWIKDTDPKSPTYGQMIGDPSSYVDMGKWIASNYLNIKSTIKVLLMAPVYAIRDISQDKDFLEAINTSKVWGDDIIKVVNGVIKPITELAKLYKDQLKDLNADDVRKVLTATIGTPIAVLTQYDPDTVMKAKGGSLVVFERVVKAMSLVKIDDKTAKNYQTNVKETVGLLKQVQSVDLDKLKTVDSIMKHMAEMTKQIHGDFEGLAEVLSDELLEVLEKLTDTLEGIRNGGSAPKTLSFADLTPAKSGTQKVNEPKQDNKPNQNNAALAKDVADLRTSIDKIYKLLDNRTGFPVKIQR